MDVRLPNGKLIQGIPEGTSKEEIQRKAIESGLATMEDFGVQQVAPEAVPVATPEVAEERDLIDRIVGGAETAASVGSGMIAEPIAGLAGIARAANPFTEETGADRAKEVREALTFTPRTESGQAGVQQLSETVQPVADALQNLRQTLGDYTFEQTDSPALASLSQVLPDALLELLGVGVAKRGAKSVVTSPQVRQAADTAEQALLRQEADTGITQMTSDVMPPETRTGRLLQQQGELVAGSRRSAQQQQRIESIDRLLGSFDVSDAARYEGAIVEGVKNQLNIAKSILGDLYEQSSSKLDELGRVPLTNTRKFAREFISKEGRKGSLADDLALRDMEDILQAPEDLTFEEIKSIRSSIGQKLQKSKQGAPVQGSSDTALLNQLYSRLTQDLGNFARAADPSLFADWKRADAEYSSFATGANKPGLKALVKRGETTPEVVDQLLFSNKRSDVDFVADNIDEAGRQAAKQRVLQMALQRSDIGGEINPNRFSTQLTKLRNQVDAVFSPEESKAITELNKVLEKTRRAQDSSITTPTGQQVLPFAVVAAPAALLPGVYQAIVETPSIRNILVRRAAAKNARKIAQLDAELTRQIEASGLLGAVSAGTPAPETENGTSEIPATN